MVPSVFKKGQPNERWTVARTMTGRRTTVQPRPAPRSGHMTAGDGPMETMPRRLLSILTLSLSCWPGWPPLLTASARARPRPAPHARAPPSPGPRPPPLRAWLRARMQPDAAPPWRHPVAQVASARRNHSATPPRHAAPARRPSRQATTPSPSPAGRHRAPPGPRRPPRPPPHPPRDESRAHHDPSAAPSTPDAAGDHPQAIAVGFGWVDCGVER